MRSLQRYSDDWCPWILAIAGAVLARWWLPVNRDAFYELALTVSSVTVGFLATMLGILLTIDHQPIMQRIRKDGIYGRVIGQVRRALWLSFLAVLVSAVVFAKMPALAALPRLEFGLWLASIFAATTACAQAVYDITAIFDSLK